MELAHRSVEEKTQPLTSLPVDTQRLHGRFVSHARCFFLQLTHADGTWAFALRAMPGAPATSCPSGESSSLDSPRTLCLSLLNLDEVPDVSASVLLGVNIPRAYLTGFLFEWSVRTSVGLILPDVDGREEVDGRDGGVAEY